MEGGGGKTRRGSGWVGRGCTCMEQPRVLLRCCAAWCTAHAGCAPCSCCSQCTPAGITHCITHGHHPPIPPTVNTRLTPQSRKAGDHILGIVWDHLKHVALIHHLSQHVTHVIRHLVTISSGHSRGWGGGWGGWGEVVSEEGFMRRVGMSPQGVAGRGGKACAGCKAQQAHVHMTSNWAG